MELNQTPALQITYIKKDEGFESDGESSTTTLGSVKVGVDSVDNAATAGVDIKIIKDHVGLTFFSLLAFKMEQATSDTKGTSFVKSLVIK